MVGTLYTPKNTAVTQEKGKALHQNRQLEVLAC